METIGDAYMAASGHDGKADHAMRLLQMAIGMLKEVRTIQYNKEDLTPTQILTPIPNLS